MNKNINDALVAVSLPLMLLLVSPLTMFFTNRGEYQLLSSLQACTGSFILFLFVSLMLFLFLKIAHKISLGTYCVVIGLLLGLSVLVWLQSQLLVWDLGPLDGKELNLECFAGKARLELVIWLVVLPVTVFLAYKKNTLVEKFLFVFPVLGILSLLVLYVTSPVNCNNDLHGNYRSLRENFTFHKKNNTIIIILDMYQSDVFYEIMTNHPKEVEFLKGFDFFPDCVAGYPATEYSVPQILTGDFHNAGVKSERGKKWLGTYYEDKNFGVVGDLWAVRFNKQRDICLSPAVRDDFDYLGLTGSQIHFIEIGLFRAAPIILKQYIYNHGSWSLSFAAQKNWNDGYDKIRSGDWKLVKKFNRYANIDSIKSGEFKFFHMMGPHFPMSVDSNYRPIAVHEQTNTRQAYVNQARGVLKLTKLIIDKMQKLDIYKDAEILIVGDHGSHSSVLPIDMRGNKNSLEIPEDHLGAARPLFLYKAIGRTGKLSVNSTPMHLAYINCLLCQFNQVAKCKDFKQALLGKSVTRYHYRCEGVDLPKILYEINGDSRNYSSWMYADRNCKAVTGMYDQYAMGTKVDFGKNGTSEHFIVKGWSKQEDGHRWTSGSEAVLGFKAAAFKNQDILVTATGRGISPGVGKTQQIDVKANGILIATWQLSSVSQLLQAKISKKMNNSDILTLTFIIKKPVSPLELGLSDDSRKLGLALQSIVLSKELSN